ncbi:MAG: hypothetical protein A3H91_05510 [Gammaproteobacteria bacterium RIFCSPLOWO2_02_FULL_61_13]|nr:MAG: hypothetical protein A3H91_05510 [Gammaproteobacteria bacterium RIFCSPLOWO2_02_FULL_61_13]
MKRATNIAIAVGAALSLGLAAAAVSAHGFGYGGGWGGGWGGGHMGGYGAGYGMGPGHMGGYGPGYGMGPGMMGGYGPGYGMGPQAMFNGNSGTTEERLAGLKSELGITANQESAWQAFVKNGSQRDENRRAWFAKMHEAGPSGSLPERLALRDEMFKQHQAEQQATTAALKQLYAALTPQQKTIADRRFGGFGPGYGAGYGRGYGGGPGRPSR